MLGNDIIDIKKAQIQSNWRRPGWLEKICTSDEIKVIHDSSKPTLMVWRIWSMKESAYKIYIQEGNEHAFNPKQFRTEIADKTYGSVQYPNKEVFTKTTSNKKYISTLATHHSELEFTSNIVTFDNLNDGFISHTLRLHLLNSISTLNNYKRSDLTIRSNSQRVPKVYLQDQVLPYSISMSHHGQYGSYMISKQ